MRSRLRRRIVQGGLALCAVPGPVAHGQAARVEYPKVVRGRELVFPRDHGSHPDYRTEWWYITGWVRTERGEALGVQVTFFRSRSPWRSDNPSRLAPTQFIFAHAAIADTGLRRLRHDQRGGRAALGLAGADEENTRVWIDDWRLELAGDRYRARVVAAEFAYELEFLAPGPPLLQGDAGFSRKGAEPHQASYYYSRPHLAVTGEVERDGRKERVTGEAWLDHEWSSEIMSEEAAGWDWIGVNLDGGGALMAFQMRDRAGAKLWAAGTIARGAGRAATFGPGEVSFEPLERWTSPRTDATYPVRLRVRVGQEEWNIVPLMNDQELDSRLSVGTVYWEGAVRLMSGPAEVGRGYLELTGYWRPMRL